MRQHQINYEPQKAIMTDSNHDLTPEEQTALDRDNRMMEVLRAANQDSGSSIEDLIPGATRVSQLQYWAPIDRPDARARLKQALSSGADGNEKSDADQTPLHGAALNGVLENVKLLLAHGADINAKLTDGRTPLDLAKAQEYADVVAFLESQGGK